MEALPAKAPKSPPITALGTGSRRGGRRKRGRAPGNVRGNGAHNRGLVRGQVTAPDLQQVFPDLGGGRPPVFPRKEKSGANVARTSMGVLKDGNRNRRRSRLRSLVNVAKKIGGLLGIRLSEGLENKFMDEEKAEKTDVNEEEVVDETLELLCGHFEAIRDKMIADGVGSTGSTVGGGEEPSPPYPTLDSQAKGRSQKSVSFGNVSAVATSSNAQDAGYMNGFHDEDAALHHKKSLDRVTSFGSDSIYEFVGEEVEAGDFNYLAYANGLKQHSSPRVNGVSTSFTRTAPMSEYTAIQKNDEDLDDEVVEALPIVGESSPNRDHDPPGVYPAPRSRRVSAASRSSRDSTERPALPPPGPAVAGKKPSFHLDLGMRADSYMTNITSRKSIGVNAASIKEQQEQLHKEFMAIFGSNHDMYVPSTIPGQNLIKVASGELYTEEPISRRWSLGKEIGKSENSTVRMATRILKDGERGRDDRVEYAAVKTICKLNGEFYKENAVSREIFCFRLLGFEEMHENVVQLYEVCEDNTSVYIVMEWLEGGELFTRISERGQYTEKDAANLVVAMLNGIKFCHRRNVVHRDVKPENFVFARAPSRESEAKDIKLTDFGIAHYSEDLSVPCMTLIGTPLYMAPEILFQQGYGPAADLWSLGIIVHIMLAGYAPFDDNDVEQLVKKIKYRTVKFDGPEWVLISQQGKNFITSLLEKDPSKRMTAEEALEHKWLRNNCHAATMNTLEVAQINIKSFVTKRRWKAAINGVRAMNRLQRNLHFARVVARSNRDIHAIDERQSESRPSTESRTSLQKSPSLTRAMTTRRPPDSASQNRLVGVDTVTSALQRSSTEGVKRAERQYDQGRRHVSDLRDSVPIPRYGQRDERLESGSTHWRMQARRIRESRHANFASGSRHDRDRPAKENRTRTVKMGDPGTQSLQTNNASVVVRPAKRPSGFFHFCFR